MPNKSARHRPTALGLLVLDCGLRGLTGHHAGLIGCLIAEARVRGMWLQVLAGDTLAVPSEWADQRVEPFFSCDLYQGASLGTCSWDFDTWLSVSDALSRDLRAIPSAYLDAANVILLPAITQYHMPVLCSWLNEVMSRHGHLRVAIQLMFAPTWTAWDQISLAGPQLYREAWRRLSGMDPGRVGLFAENEATANVYRNLLDHEVSILPHPVDWSGLTVSTNVGRAGQPVRAAFLGYAKQEKGFHLLPSALEGLSEATRRGLEVAVQVNHSGYDPTTIAADEALRSTGGVGVKLLEGSLSASEYHKWLNWADALIMPYSPELYATRGSGLLVEAGGTGKIVVTSAQTDPGRAIEAGEIAGVTFSSYSAEGLSDALTRLVAARSELLPKAHALAAEWRSRHTGAGYLERLAGLLRP